MNFNLILTRELFFLSVHLHIGRLCKKLGSAGKRKHVKLPTPCSNVRQLAQQLSSFKNRTHCESLTPDWGVCLMCANLFMSKLRTRFVSQKDSTSGRSEHMPDWSSNWLIFCGFTFFFNLKSRQIAKIGNLQKEDDVKDESAFRVVE